MYTEGVNYGNKIREGLSRNDGKMGQNTVGLQGRLVVS